MHTLDSDKARQKLGWQDTVDLGAGIEETIAWVLSYGAKQIGTLTYSLRGELVSGTRTLRSPCGTSRVKIELPVFPQSRPYTCVAACLRSVLLALGSEHSEASGE